MEAIHRAPTDEMHARRILLIADSCSAGETLRIVPYFMKVRERYPNAHMTLLTNEDGLAGVTHAGAFDRVVISKLYVYRRCTRLRRYAAQVRESLRLMRLLGAGYDLVVTFYWGGLFLHLIAFAVSRGQRVGHADYTPFFSRWLLSSSLGPFIPLESHPPQHMALLRAAGVAVETISGPNVSYAADDAVAVGRLLQAHALAGSPSLTLLHPGSDWACQQWLQERWAQLADELVARCGADVVFTGTGSEAPYIDAIRHRMRRNSVSLAGQTTLPQLAALLRGAWLCVCVDSAIFELTQSTDTPAVVLAGSSRPETGVYGACQPIVVRRMTAELAGKITACRRRHTDLNETGCWNYECSMAGLRDISVADILAAVERLVRTGELIARV